MDNFNTIYKYNLWLFGSGSGSLRINNKKYTTFLTTFLKDHNISNVCDIGCGDWQLSKHIDWTGIHYLGIDVVKDVIKKNLIYTESNIKFICKNILDYTIPNCELYIVKDIFQHLSNTNIEIIINKLLKNKYRYILIINDVSYLNLNYNIENGLYRPIDLNKKPFNYTFKVIHHYREPFYILFYSISLSYLLYITYKKKYKLYIFSLILLICYGIFIIPSKKIYLISNTTK
jgi:SAM-dependent methyltransferase